MFVYKLKNDRNLKERIKKVNKKISQLREGYEYLKKNLFHYPNSKENNLFKLKDYESIIELLFKMETKIKKYKNLKLIKYNKIIFEYLLKLSQSKIHKRKFIKMFL